MYTKQAMIPRAFGHFMDDLLNNGIQKVWGEDSTLDRSNIAVNIAEREKSYELYLVAPGLSKDAFKLNVDKLLLTISYEKKEENSEEGYKWIRSEFQINSFKRSFTLNEKIDNTAISASYTDGILNIHLPKKEPLETSAQEIPVN